MTGPPLKLGNRQRCDEVGACIGCDDKLAVRLTLTGRELAEEFVEETPAEAVRPVSWKIRARISLGVTEAVGRLPVLPRIEIGLVECQRLDPRRISDAAHSPCPP
jgi:hypothetical protein